VSSGFGQKTGKNQRLERNNKQINSEIEFEKAVNLMK